SSVFSVDASLAGWTALARDLPVGDTLALGGGRALLVVGNSPARLLRADVHGVADVPLQAPAGTAVRDSSLQLRLLPDRFRPRLLRTDEVLRDSWVRLPQTHLGITRFDCPRCSLETRRRGFSRW